MANDQNVARLAKLLDQTQTVEANFSQVRPDADGASLTKSSGKMTARRPGLFYWHSDAPQEQVVVTDGAHATLWDPDLEQATISKQGTHLVSQMPALLLALKVDAIANGFDITSKEQGEVIDFTLRPKPGTPQFDSLRLSFRKGLPNEIEMIDSLGQRTNVIFNGVITNHHVPDSNFVFAIPQGAEVFRN
ncbi:outer membrane lipoprotein chaperone LolA [Streptomyces sp. NPDC005562]|uniref:outer membrane lipoprotein chaperone LolA n=1 Tax=Streptomyces sp. NPDC005562 TaxID=3154890 RepID=UPI0033A199EC